MGCKRVCVCVRLRVRVRALDHDGLYAHAKPAVFRRPSYMGSKAIDKRRRSVLVGKSVVEQSKRALEKQQETHDEALAALRALRKHPATLGSTIAFGGAKTLRKRMSRKDVVAAFPKGPQGPKTGFMTAKLIKMQKHTGNMKLRSMTSR